MALTKGVEKCVQNFQRSAVTNIIIRYNFTPFRERFLLTKEMFTTDSRNYKSSLSQESCPIINILITTIDNGYKGFSEVNNEFYKDLAPPLLDRRERNIICNT